METPHPTMDDESNGLEDGLPGILEVGHELSHDGAIYVVDSEDPPTPFERRYRVHPKDAEHTLRLRHRRRDNPLGGFDDEKTCLRLLQKDNPFYLVPRVVAHRVDEDGEMLLLEQSFGLSLVERYSELDDRQTLALCLEQVLLALSKIHQSGFTVTDLCPDSFTWPKDGLMELVELSRLTPVGSPLKAVEIGRYSAPELEAEGLADVQLDIYAVGALFAGAVLSSEVMSLDREAWATGAHDLMQPAVTQLLRGSLAPVSDRFQSVDEMRTLVYQLKNELVHFPRPSAASTSTVGVSRHRYINEDSVGFQEIAFNYQSRPYFHGYYCVADGMGGHELGERASQLAVLGSLQAFRQITQTFSADYLADRLPELALTIGRLASEVVTSGATQMGGSIPRMGTTFTGILVVNDELALAHVGDSRALLVRGDRLTQLSQDHSLVAALVRVGQITREEAETMEGRNVLVRCIDASSPMAEEDFDGLHAVGFKDGRFKVQSGDRLVLVTDGVWGVLNPEVIRQLVSSSSTPQDISDALVKAAITVGSEDNATVLAVVWH